MTIFPLFTLPAALIAGKELPTLSEMSDDPSLFALNESPSGSFIVNCVANNGIVSSVTSETFICPSLPGVAGMEPACTAVKLIPADATAEHRRSANISKRDLVFVNNIFVFLDSQWD